MSDNWPASIQCSIVNTMNEEMYWMKVRPHRRRNVDQRLRKSVRAAHGPIRQRWFVAAAG